MLDLFLRIFGIITPVLIVSAIGYGYAKLCKPDMTWTNRLSTDLLFPLLTLSSMASKDFEIVKFLPLMGCAVIMILATCLIGWLATRLFHYNPHAFIPPIIFSNTGNMGLPLTIFAFGEKALPAAIAVFMIYSLFHFTLGLKINNPKANLTGLLKGPMIWAMIIGSVMSALHLSLPPWLATSTHMLGETAIPLGLFALGVGFASFKIDRWSIGLVGALLRPIAGLAVAYPIVEFIPLDQTAKGILLLYAALPPAILNFIFSERFNQDPGQVAAIVVGGHLLSLISIPIALFLAFSQQ